MSNPLSHQSREPRATSSQHKHTTVSPGEAYLYLISLWQLSKVKVFEYFDTEGTRITLCAKI